MVTESTDKTYSRREVLKMAGATGIAVALGGGLGGLIAACGGEDTATTTGASMATTSTGVDTTGVSAGPETGRDLLVGVVAPRTGALAPFGYGVEWTIKRVGEYLRDGIVCADGKVRGIKLVTQDTQSDSNRAAQVTADLIHSEGVDIILSAGSPETIAPSADTCEALGCPSLSCAGPWQAFYFDRKPPEAGFKWTYGFLTGSEQTIACFAEMFEQIPNNKIVGMLFSNDADAAGWMAENAAPAVFEALGYTLVIPSWYTPGTEDFTQQISEFKKAGCEILCGSNTPPDFTNFWKQAVQQGFRPKLASCGRGLLYPQTLDAIGEIGYGLIGEIGWHRTFPYKDYISGQTAQELADDFEAKTGLQHSTTSCTTNQIMEWAVDVFKRAANPEDKESIVEAIKTTNMVCTSGPIDFTAAIDPMGWHPVPNVVKAPFCGGQWVQGEKHKFDIIICSAAAAPDVEVQAKVQPLIYS